MNTTTFIYGVEGVDRLHFLPKTSNFYKNYIKLQLLFSQKLKRVRDGDMADGKTFHQNDEAGE